MLKHWIARTEAVTSRFEVARKAPVQLLKLNVAHVTIPRRTLNDDGELKAWLTEVEVLICEELWPASL